MRNLFLAFALFLLGNPRALAVWIETETYLRTGLDRVRAPIHACDATLLLRYYRAVGELTPAYTFSDEFQNAGNDAMADLLRAIYAGRRAMTAREIREAHLEIAKGYRATQALHGFDALASVPGVKAIEIHDGIVTGLNIDPGEEVDFSDVPRPLLQGVSLVQLRTETRPRHAKETLAFEAIEQAGLFDRVHEVEMIRLHPQVERKVLQILPPTLTRLVLDPRRTTTPFLRWLDRLEKIELRLDGVGARSDESTALVDLFQAIAAHKTALPLRDLRLSSTLRGNDGGGAAVFTEDEATALAKALESPALGNLESLVLEWVLPPNFDVTKITNSAAYKRLRHFGVRAFTQANSNLLLATLNHANLESLETYGILPHLFFTQFGQSELHNHLKRLVVSRHSTLGFVGGGVGRGSRLPPYPIEAFANSVTTLNPSKLRHLDFRGFSHHDMPDPGLTTLLTATRRFPDLIAVYGVIPPFGLSGRTPFEVIGSKNGQTDRIRELHLDWPRLVPSAAYLEDPDYVQSIADFLRSPSAQTLTQLSLPLIFLASAEIVAALQDPRILPALYVLKFNYDLFWDRELFSRSPIRRLRITRRQLQPLIDRGVLVTIEANRQN